jgi:hypothetical protein
MGNWRWSWWWWSRWSASRHHSAATNQEGERDTRHATRTEARPPSPLGVATKLGPVTDVSLPLSLSLPPPSSPPCCAVGTLPLHTTTHVPHIATYFYTKDTRGSGKKEWPRAREPQTQ